MSQKKLGEVEAEFSKYKELVESQDIRKQLNQKTEQIISMQQELEHMNKLKGDIFEIQMQNQELKEENLILRNKVESRKELEQEYNSPILSHYKLSHKSIESDENPQLNEFDLDTQHKQEIENYE